MRNFLVPIIAGLTTLALAAPSWAGSVSFTFTRPTNRADAKVKIIEKKSNGDVVETTEATITPGMTAEQKRDAIKAALEAKGYTVTSTGTPPQDPGITISAVRAGRKVCFNGDATGEANDSETVPKATVAVADFAGSLLSSDWTRRPASFTAGLVTDLGKASYTYVASDVPAGTLISGKVIANRLYEGLAAAAADLGAHLDLDGGSLRFTFNEDTSTRGATMIFGTTSRSPGLTGEIVVPADDDEVVEEF